MAVSRELQGSPEMATTMASADPQGFRECRAPRSNEMSARERVRSQSTGEMVTLGITKTFADQQGSNEMSMSANQQGGSATSGTADMSLETPGTWEMTTMMMPADWQGSVEMAPTTGMASDQQGVCATSGTADMSLETPSTWEMTTTTIPDSQGSEEMSTARTMGMTADQQGESTSSGTAETQGTWEMTTTMMPANWQGSGKMATARTMGMAAGHQGGSATVGTAETQGTWEMTTTTIPADWQGSGELATATGMATGQQGQSATGGTAEIPGTWEMTTTTMPAYWQGSGEMATVTDVSTVQQGGSATSGTAKMSLETPETWEMTTMSIPADWQGSGEMATATGMAAGQQGGSATGGTAETPGTWEMTTMAIPANWQGSGEMASATGVSAGQEGGRSISGSAKMSLESQGAYIVRGANEPINTQTSGVMATAINPVVSACSTEEMAAIGSREISLDGQESWVIKNAEAAVKSPEAEYLVTSSNTTEIPHSTWEMATMEIPADSQGTFEMATTETMEISIDQEGSWEMTTMVIPADSEGSFQMVTTEISADAQGAVEMTTTEHTEISTSTQGSWEITTIQTVPEESYEVSLQEAARNKPARKPAAVQCDLWEEVEFYNNPIEGDVEIVALKSTVETLKQRMGHLELEKTSIMETYQSAIQQYEISSTSTVQEYEVKLGQMRIQMESLERKNAEAMLEIQMAKEQQLAINERERDNQGKAEEAGFIFEGKLKQLQEENEALLNAYKKNASDYEIKITKIQKDYEMKLGQVKMDRDRFEDSNEDLIVMYNKTVSDYKIRITEIEDDFKTKLNQTNMDMDKLETKHNIRLQEIAELKAKCKSLEERYDVFVKEVEDDNNESQKWVDKEDALEKGKQELVKKHKTAIAEYEARIKEMRENYDTQTGRLEKEKDIQEEKHKEEVKSWMEKVNSLKQKHKEEIRQLENEMLKRFDAEKDKMKARFSRENEEVIEARKNLIEDYEVKVTDIRQEYDLTLVQMEVAKCKLEKDLNDRIDSLQQEMATKEKDHDTRRKELIQELTEKYSYEKSEREATFVKERTVLIESHKETVSDYEITIKEIEQENEAQLAQANRERQRLTQTCDLFSVEINEWKTKCSSLEEFHAKAIKDSEEAYKRKLEEMEVENQRRVETQRKLEQEHEIKMAEVQHEHKTKLAVMNTTIEKEEEKYYKETENWRSRFTSSEETFERRIQSMEKEIKAILRRETNTKDALTKEKEEMLKNHKNDLKNYETNIKKIHQDYQDKIAKLETHWQQANEKLSETAREEQIQATTLNELHEARIKELNFQMTEEWNVERQEMRTMFLKERDEVAKRHDDVERKYEEQIRAVRREFELKTTQLEVEKKTAEKRLEKLQWDNTLLAEKYEEQMTKERVLLESFIKEKNEMEQKLSSQNEEMENVHQQVVKGYEEKLKSLEQKLNNELSEIRRKERANKESERAYRDNYEISMKKTVDEMVATFNREKEDIETGHRNEIKDLTSKHGTILHQTQEECANNLAQAVKQYELRLTDVQENFKVDLEYITEERNRLREECKEFAEDGADKDIRHKKYMHEMKAIIKQSETEHKMEIGKMTKTLKNIEETVKEKTEHARMCEQEKEMELNSRREDRHEFEITLQLLENNIIEYKETIRVLEETVHKSEQEKIQLTASYDELVRSKQSAETKFFEETVRLQGLLDNEFQQKLKLGKDIQELLENLLNLKQKYGDLEKRYAHTMTEMNDEFEKHAHEKGDGHSEGDLRVKMLLEQQMQRCAVLEKEKENLEVTIKDLTEKPTEINNQNELDGKFSEEKVHKLEEENQNLLAEVYRLKSQNEEYEEAFKATWDLQLRSSKLQEESKYWKTTCEEISAKQEQMLIENDRLTSEVKELLRTRDIEAKSRDKEHRTCHSERENGQRLDDLVAAAAKGEETGNAKQKNVELEGSLDSFRLKVIFLTKEKSDMAQQETYEHEISNERQQSRSDHLEEQSKEWESKFEEMRNKFIEEIEAIRNEMNENSIKFESEKEILVESFNKKRESFQRKLTDQKQAHEREKEITIHQCRVDMLVMKETEVIKTEFEREKYELLNNMDQEKARTKVEFERRLQIEMNDYNNALERQQRETETLKRVKTQLEARIQETVRKQEEEKYRLSTSFSDEKRRINEEYYANLEEVKKASLEEIAEMRKQKEKEGEKKLQEEIQAIEKRVRDELSSKLHRESSAREMYLQEALYAVEQESDISRERLLQLERKIISSKEQFQYDKALIIEQCKREKDDLQRKLEHEKEMLKLAHDAAKAELRRQTEHKGSLVHSIQIERKETGNIHENGTKLIKDSKRGSVGKFEDEHTSASHTMKMSYDDTYGGFKKKGSGAEEVTGLDCHSRGKLGFQEHSLVTQLTTSNSNQGEDKIVGREFQKRSEQKTSTQEAMLASFITEVAELREDKKNLEREVARQQTISGTLIREIDALRSDFSHLRVVVGDLSQSRSIMEHRIHEPRNANVQRGRGSPSQRVGYQLEHLEELVDARTVSREERSTRMQTNAQSYTESSYGSHSARERRELDTSFDWLRLPPDDRTPALHYRTNTNSGQRFDGQRRSIDDKDKIYVMAQRNT